MQDSLEDIDELVVLVGFCERCPRASSGDHDSVFKIFEELEFARMKENFKKLFFKHDVVEEKNTIQEISEPKKDVQYDLFNMPGESLFKENNRLKTSSDFQKFYQINSTELSKKLVFEKLKNQNLISLNIEDDFENNQIKLLSFSWGNHKSYFTQITNNSEKGASRRSCWLPIAVALRLS